jgi:hypothetical protein
MPESCLLRLMKVDGDPWGVAEAAWLMVEHVPAARGLAPGQLLHFFRDEVVDQLPHYHPSIPHDLMLHTISIWRFVAIFRPSYCAIGVLCTSGRRQEDYAKKDLHHCNT